MRAAIDDPSPPKVWKENGETGSVEGGLVPELRIANVMLVLAPMAEEGLGLVKLKM